jgi:hypothetical protein
MERLGDTIGRIRKTITQEANTKIDKELCPAAQAVIFSERLSQIIKPRDQSDRTCFRRIANWILRKINTKELPATTFETVLGFAVEAAGPDSRNPAAVFMKILKTELRYGVDKS